MSQSAGVAIADAFYQLDAATQQLKHELNAARDALLTGAEQAAVLEVYNEAGR